ncbi:MAG: alpha/beta fold hydrolase [Henriciella sp.]
MLLLKWTLSILILLFLAAAALYVIAGLEAQKIDDAAREKAPGEFIELTDGKLHYRWDGPEDGSVIVMVHGYVTPHYVFEPNAEALNEAGFRTLRFDHFGRGWSDRPRVKYDIDFYDRALLELLDELQITQPVGIVGLSMGGIISTEFAVRHPDRVEKLFLIAPTGLDLAGTDGFMVKLMRVPVIGDWIWRMSWKSVMKSSYAEAEASLSPENMPPGDVNEQMAYRGFSEALLSTFRHLPMSDRGEAYSALSQTDVPMAAVFGADDETVLVSSVEKLETLMPEAEITVLEGATHVLNLERQAEVNPRMVDWFTGEGKEPN